jgi:hypothetical protein
VSSFDDRQCPHPVCETTIDSARFACPRHWFTLPVEVRNGINRAWRRITRPGGIADLEAAQQRALDLWAKP